MADVVWDRPSICANTQSFHLPAVVAARVKSILSAFTAFRHALLCLSAHFTRFPLSCCGHDEHIPSTFPDGLPAQPHSAPRHLCNPHHGALADNSRRLAGRASRQHQAPGTALSYLRSHACQQNGIGRAGFSWRRLGSNSRLHLASSSRVRASAFLALFSHLRPPLRLLTHRLSPRHPVDIELGAMKLSGILFSSLLCVASAHAQYFSAGWTPGQKAPVAEQASPDPAYTFDPAAHAAQATAAAGKQPGIVDRLLTSGPVASLFGKMGLNMTDAVARGSLSPWDERIPLVTDENFVEMIVNETLTAQEERERVWFLIVCVSSFFGPFLPLSPACSQKRRLSSCSVGVRVSCKSDLQEIHNSMRMLMAGLLTVR